MGLRRWSIRLRIFLLVALPILSLIGLYAFAATITSSNAINLTRARAVKDTIATPVGNVESALEAERLTAVIYLAAPVPRDLAALQAQEHKTDLAVAGFKAAAASAASSASAPEKQAFATMLADMAHLPALRSQIATLAISRPQAISAYGSILDQDYAVLTQVILQQQNVQLVTQSLALARTGKVVDLVLQEDALLLGDTLRRSFSAAERQDVTQLVGARRVLYVQILSDFEPSIRAIYANDVSSHVAGPLQALENKVIADSPPRRIPPGSPTSWSPAVQTVSAGLSQAGTQAADARAARAQPAADSTFLRLVLVGGLA